jgi:hypothetical protein
MRAVACADGTTSPKKLIWRDAAGAWHILSEDYDAEVVEWMPNGFGQQSLDVGDEVYRSAQRDKLGDVVTGDLVDTLGALPAAGVIGLGAGVGLGRVLTDANGNYLVDANGNYLTD